MSFNPNEHLISLKGKAYLEVKWRLVWFRMEHPDWGISTQLVKFDPEAKYAIFHSTITDENGRVIAEGTKMEDSKGFADYLEKAETGSIGRALGILGYGTQFAPEFDEVDPTAGNPRIVDAPINIQVPVTPKPLGLKSKFRDKVQAFYPGATPDDCMEVFRKLTGSDALTDENLEVAIRTLDTFKSAEQLTKLMRAGGE
jgi:hypothetical protein